MGCIDRRLPALRTAKHSYISLLPRAMSPFSSPYPHRTTIGQLPSWRIQEVDLAPRHDQTGAIRWAGGVVRRNPPPLYSSLTEWLRKGLRGTLFQLPRGEHISTSWLNRQKRVALCATQGTVSTFRRPSTTSRSWSTSISFSNPASASPHSGWHCFASVAPLHALDLPVLLSWPTSSFLSLLLLAECPLTHCRYPSLGEPCYSCPRWCRACQPLKWACRPRIGQESSAEDCSWSSGTWKPYCWYEGLYLWGRLRV